MDNLSQNSHELPAPKSGLELYTPESASSAQNIDREDTTKEIKIADHPIPNQQTAPMITISSTVVTTAQSDDVGNNSIGNSPAAEDLDVMEKEWIVKAKKVVSDTKNDPRQQNIELAKVKAEYIKKRFNKALKIDDNK